MSDPHRDDAEAALEFGGAGLRPRRVHVRRPIPTLRVRLPRTPKVTTRWDPAARVFAQTAPRRELAPAPLPPRATVESVEIQILGSSASIESAVVDLV